MKRLIFWSVCLTVFLRLQIYEAIVAIFWQSASYVLSFRLTDFRLMLKFFRPQKQDKQVKPEGHQVAQQLLEPYALLLIASVSLWAAII